MRFASFARAFAVAALVTSACASPPPVSHPADLQALASDVPQVGPEMPQFSEIAEDERPQPPAETGFVQHLYRIGVGDVLRIVGDLDFLRGFGETSEGRVEGNRVKEDGNIYLPRIGAVAAAGRTALEVQQDLQQRLLKFDKNAYVSVDVLEYRSQKFFLLGAVERPGPYPIDNNVSVIEGVAMAGGVTDKALLDQSYVVRGDRVLPVSLQSIYRGDLKLNISVRHGDLVYVPSVEDAEVYVVGEVKKAGPVPFTRRRLSLVAALAGAGGLNERAEPNVVRVFRGDLYSPRCFTVSLCEALKAGAAIELQPGDRIYVGTSANAKYDTVLKLVGPMLQAVTLAAATAKTFSD